MKSMTKLFHWCFRERNRYQTYKSCDSFANRWGSANSLSYQTRDWSFAVTKAFEVLIHIGIDTVSLEGKYFTMNVKQGDRVRTGQPIGEVDFEKVREAGYDPTTIVVITNTNDFLDVIPTSNNQLVKSDDLLNIVLQ